MNLDLFQVKETSSIKDALLKIEQNHLGIIFVSDGSGRIKGCATDGDIRRALLKGIYTQDKISSCMNKKFVFLFDKHANRENALKILDAQVRAIPVLNEKNQLVNIFSDKDFKWNVEQQVISKAKSPVRISFAGGGTDITSYFYQNAGVVLNSTINKYSHASLIKRSDSKIILFSNDLKLKLEYKDLSKVKYNGQLDLVKSVIKDIDPDFGFELYTYSDVPPGSGLGGSAVLLSAIIGTFNNFRNDKLTNYEVAELAFHAERIGLGLSGGWQDQYATVFGGFNFIEFNSFNNIVHPLRISENTINELEDSLILCYTGICHNSGNIHDDQKNIMKKKEIAKYAEASKEIAYEMKSRLLKNQLDDFGKLLHEAWNLKKYFSSRISNDHLDAIYDYAMKNGALGGKLLGAGGGGYFLFYIHTLKKFGLINALEKKGLKTDNFSFSNEGLKCWITKLRG